MAHGLEVHSRFVAADQYPGLAVLSLKIERQRHECQPDWATWFLKVSPEVIWLIGRRKTRPRALQLG